MAISCKVTINGRRSLARRGELLLDAALSNGVDLPYDCRAGTLRHLLRAAGIRRRTGRRRF